MTSRMPPVPPGSRSPKGTGGDPQMQAAQDPGNPQKANPDKIGQAANTKVNTTNQGHQQDR